MRDHRLFVLVRRRLTRVEHMPEMLALDAELFAAAQTFPGFEETDILVGEDDAAELWHAETWSSDVLHQEADDGPTHASFMPRSEPYLSDNEAYHFRFASRTLGTRAAADAPWSDRTTTIPVGADTSDGSHSGPVVVVERWTAVPGSRLLLVNETHDLMGEAGEADGFLAGDVVAGVPAPAVLWRYETWTDRVRMEAWRNGARYRRFLVSVDASLNRREPPLLLRIVGRYVGSASSPATDQAPLIRPLPPEAMDANAKDVYAEAPAPLQVFGLLAHAGAAFGPVVELTRSLLADGNALRPQLRQIAILEAARAGDSAYEWEQHVALSRKAGLSDEKIDAIARLNRDAGCFDPDERLVLKASAEVTGGVGRMVTATTKALGERFGEACIVELLLTIGHYRSMATLINSAGLAVDVSPS